MQDPNSLDPEDQVRGAPPGADAAGVPAQPSPTVVETEAPALGGDAVTVPVTAPSGEEPAAEEVPAAVAPSDVPSPAAEPAVEDIPAEEATTEEPPAEEAAVAEGGSATDAKPSAGTTVDEAVGASEEPAATTADERASVATDSPPAEPLGGIDESPVEAPDEGLRDETRAVASETTGTPAGDVTEGVGEAYEEGAAAGGLSEPILPETTDAPTEEELGGVAGAPAGEAGPTGAEEGTAGDQAAVETDEAAEGVAEVTDETATETPADTAAAAAVAGGTAPLTEAEEATGAVEESEVTPVFDESVPDVVDAGATGEVPATGEEPVAAAEAATAEPVGSEVAVAEPAATPVQPPRGVWTEEQVEAARARLSEATAKFVDKAAGVVMETVNFVAATIRSRASRDRRG